MDFVALDVETANADMASICQIGLARFSNGKVVEEWVSYIDPEDYFDLVNISIHGITENMVRGAPKYINVHDQLCQLLENRIIITHTAFDRVSLAQINGKHKTCLPACTWLDSARVARRTWEEYAWKGYGVFNICKALNYNFEHHNALEDAKATGVIMLAAMERTGLDLEAWLRRVKQPVDLTAPTNQPIRRDGNPEGPLYGEILVFTGALEITRREAADMAAQIGCTVASGVTKQTTMLVVGDQDVTRLAGHEKSTKHRKAEELILKDCPIRILRESDFRELVAVTLN
jgi:DNA polymerase-3 subunit epsilon